MGGEDATNVQEKCACVQQQFGHGARCSWPNAKLLGVYRFRASGTVHQHDLLAQAEVVQVDGDLRLELRGVECLERTLQVHARAGGDVKRDVALQPEAAIAASAEACPDHADSMAGRIVQPKNHLVVADGQGWKLALGFLDVRSGLVVRNAKGDDSRHSEDQREHEKNVWQYPEEHCEILWLGRYSTTARVLASEGSQVEITASS